MPCTPGPFVRSKSRRCQASQAMAWCWKVRSGGFRCSMRCEIRPSGAVNVSHSVWPGWNLNQPEPMKRSPTVMRTKQSIGSQCSSTL